MANKVKTRKPGMGGNRYGGRWEKTEVLKDQLKTARRRADRAETEKQLPDLGVHNPPRSERLGKV